MLYIIGWTVFALITATIIIGLILAAIHELLNVIDRSREVIKTTALDSIQVWSSGHMSVIDIDHARHKLETKQDYSQIKLDEYRQYAQLKIREQRFSLGDRNEATK